MTEIKFLIRKMRKPQPSRLLLASNSTESPQFTYKQPICKHTQLIKYAAYCEKYPGNRCPGRSECCVEQSVCLLRRSTRSVFINHTQGSTINASRHLRRKEHICNRRVKPSKKVFLSVRKSPTLVSLVTVCSILAHAL
jgi:hypothetical protein